ATGRNPRAVSALHLPILYSFGHQWHRKSPSLSNSVRRGNACAGGLVSPLDFRLALANPAFDSLLPVHGAGLCKAIINVSPQLVERHAAFVIHFRARQ